jgi:hypothetical protein
MSRGFKDIAGIDVSAEIAANGCPTLAPFARV